MRSPDGFRFGHQGLGVDACLNLSSAVLYYRSDSSHSESIAVLGAVAESSTVAVAPLATASQHETSPQRDHGL
jgi:hypothetical protein